MTCLSFSPKSQLLDSQPLSRLALCSLLFSRASLVQQNQDFGKGSSVGSSPPYDLKFESPHVGTSRDRLGPGLTKLLGIGWGPGQAQGSLPSWQAVATACSDFWTLLGASFLGQVNQALQNATHLDRMGKSLRGGHYGAGVKGQPGLSLRVPVLSQVSSKAFIRTEL